MQLLQLRQNKIMKNKRSLEDLSYNSQYYKYFNILPITTYVYKKIYAIMCGRCKIWKTDINISLCESEKNSKSILF
jgi:hypothetical protein